MKLGKYEEILNLFYKNFESFRNLSNLKSGGGDFIDDFFKNRLKEGFEWCDNIRIYYGMSRFVIIHDDEDFVLKIPHNERGLKDCEREQLVFNEALKVGLSFMFAEVGFLCNYNDINVFWAEKAEADEDYATERYASYHGYDTSSPDFSTSDVDTSDGEALVEDIFHSFFSCEDVWNFYDFCGEWDVNDIHLGNIGFDGDTVKCIDYAGY